MLAFCAYLRIFAAILHELLEYCQFPSRGLGGAFPPDIWKGEISVIQPLATP